MHDRAQGWDTCISVRNKSGFTSTIIAAILNGPEIR